MFEKISPRKIVEDHLATLVHFGTEESKATDYFVFFGIPALIATCLVFIAKVSLSTDGITFVATSLSIFSALLFNLLLLSFDLVRKYKKQWDDAPQTKSEILKYGLKATYANISFSILVAIFTIVILVLYFILKADFDAVQGAKVAINLLTYWLIGVFLITQFMVVRSIHALLGDAFDEIS